MSEYQHYEWQTIDRALSLAEQREVNQLSSHMDTVTSTQAVVTYSWGDFKHDPQEVLLKYFDAFLYDSNFGSRRLIFRLPAALVDVEAIRAYCVEEWIMLEDHGKYLTLEIIGENDNGYEWVESDDTLSQLIPLRDQLLQGDYRMLYVVWLKAMQEQLDEDGEEISPPIPAGLNSLNASLQVLIEFFEISPHIIRAAATFSKKTEVAPASDLSSLIPKLTRAEADQHLLQLLRGEPGALIALKKRLMSLSGDKTPINSPIGVSISELTEQAEQIEREAARKAREEAEQRRLEKLERLARNEEATWRKVEDLLVQKRAGAYDEATSLLVELKELATYQKKMDEYRNHFQFIRLKYGKSIALLERFKRAGLLSDQP